MSEMRLGTVIKGKKIKWYEWEKKNASVRKQKCSDHKKERKKEKETQLKECYNMYDMILCYDIILVYKSI